MNVWYELCPYLNCSCSISIALVIYYALLPWLIALQDIILLKLWCHHLFRTPQFHWQLDKTSTILPITLHHIYSYVLHIGQVQIE